jgi:hypothetical protein
MFVTRTRRVWSLADPIKVRTSKPVSRGLAKSPNAASVVLKSGKSADQFCSGSEDPGVAAVLTFLGTRDATAFYLSHFQFRAKYKTKSRNENDVSCVIWFRELLRSDRPKVFSQSECYAFYGLEIRKSNRRISQRTRATIVHFRYRGLQRNAIAKARTGVVRCKGVEASVFSVLRHEYRNPKE